ncbi:MAG: helix-turn-helix domain-containing protein [Maricaulaceae bacterium]
MRPPIKRRFNEELRRTDIILSELQTLDGQRLRAARLLQESTGVFRISGAADHTLGFQLGGSNTVKRFYEGQLSGIVNKLRHTTVLPAFRASEWDLGGEIDVLDIYMDDATLRGIAEEGFGFKAGDVEILDRICVDDEVIAALAPILLAEMASDDPASALMLDSFDQVIATHILRRYSSRSREAEAVVAAPPPQPNADMVAKAKAYLLERQAENVSLDAVARHVGLSKFHFQRRFRAELGLSPHEFVQQARIKQVRDLLKGPASLAEIAVDCGFSSQQHMTNAFTRHMGVSPGRYRKQILA